ncbi:Rpn family recombination-promoting nuclease/putative transposase [Oscillatoria sp. FACHB-1406]|uniref:Rpn family recombination-promoting nuclease/putative transposase n=1 Tax=Oscillatoria sp. FACHB-1406 TaxID=2692846 RepID=UPI001686188D|nr:Rpn family recombination-promoting nuclease/putative transposase [Oscillatoria sp. FACHB-1406]MBD2576832.1 Rpn family recombination-promoting nuclease/putative transposase [Oscillatoria sp. FACHB-1406]
MNFVNPKTDFAFKKIFGSQQSKAILISFLNSILYPSAPYIKNLKILNPYQAPRIRGIKDTYLDIKALLSDGTTVIIEMQVLNIEGFEKRILYNAAKSYSIQLAPGDDYTLLNPVIALTITDFEMFPDIERAITRFILKERDYLVDYIIDDLELVFVELPKFNRELDELTSLADKWLYFIKNARELEKVPDDFQEVPELKRAFEIANRANLSREELEELEKHEIFIHDQRNAIKRALKQGLEKGRKQGLEKGLKEGLEKGQKAGHKEGRKEGLKEGREEGRREAQIVMVRQLLGVLDEETIHQTTGFSLEEIRQIASEN